MAPSWFDLLAWVALGLGFASSLVIVIDIVVLGNRQHMTIMDFVCPLTALYRGQIGSGRISRGFVGCPASGCICARPG